jgi:hypothetical protein
MTDLSDQLLDTLTHEAQVARLRRWVREREAEILRLRTTETAAAHALDGLRQFFGLDLVQGEAPSMTRRRIERHVAENKSI